jgi:hypothetical protein
MPDVQVVDSARPGGLPWNYGPFTQATGYDVKIEPGSVTISMETYCIKTAKQLFGEHPRGWVV